MAGNAHAAHAFIPTFSCWLNQVEGFYALTTDKAIRRGSLTSVKQLVQNKEASWGQIRAYKY